MKMDLFLNFLLALFIISTVECKRPSKEVFGFTNFVDEKIYKKYAITKLTGLIFLDDNIDAKFIDYARENEIRTYLTGRYPADRLGDNEFRSKWFKNISINLINYRINGLNLDFSEPIKRDDKKREQLTDLVKFLKENLFNQNAEFTVSLPWSPINKNGTATNGQDYDYVEIVKHADYLLIKSFHINAQIFVGAEYDDEVCLAKSNSGFFDSAAGILKWLSLNDSIETRKFNSDLTNYFAYDLADNLNEDLNLNSKIILVYPWFGLDYPCRARVERQRCLIEAVSFIDSNCSDRVAKEVPFKDVIQTMLDQKLDLMWDPHSRSTYLEFKVNSQVHQLWFDFYSDYTLKYHYPTQFNLKGMGIYRLDYLDYENESQSKTTDYMWRLLPKF